MTITSAANKQIFAGTGAQTVFAFTFNNAWDGTTANLSAAKATMSVLFTSAAGVATDVTSQCTIALTAPVAPSLWGLGGTVTYNPSGVPIATGTTLTLLRTLPLTQTVALQNQASYGQLASSIERDTDRLEMQIQQLAENYGRAIVVAASDAVPAALPPAAQRANLAMGFDASGNPIAISSAPAGTISSAMAPVTAAASIPAALALLGERIVCTGPLALYVDNALGNDGNAGTSPGAGAMKTLQAAWNAAVNSYDFRGNALDINVADGTYGAGIITIQLPMGATTVRVNGNVTTPSSCFINAAADSPFRFQVGAGVPIQIKGFKLQSTAGILFDAGFSSVIYFTDKMEFNSSTSAHIQVSNAAAVVFFANYTITGNAVQDHHHVVNGGTLGVDGMTITLSGAPSFGGAFLGAAGCSTATYTSTTFVGGATGTRYNIHGQSYIKTAAASPSTFFPGSIAGTSDGGNLDDDTGGGAWLAFSGTPTPAGGAMTASYAGRYKLVNGSGGKTVVFHATITITNAGTGTGEISFGSPSGLAQGNAVAVARETTVTGATGSAFMINGTATFRLDKYDGNTMIVTGSNIEVSGTYERA